jgi:TonB-linked SusC/RagA family outer membrane protein
MSVRITARLRLALLALAAFAVPNVAAAQATGTVEGTVTDAGHKRPLAGVQVTIVGTGATVGAMTNAQGVYRILNVTPGQRTVRARLIGYGPVTKTVEVTAGGTATATIELAQSAVELTAVVTTGTGGSQVEARKLGNTVASIEPPANAPISSFSDVLQGREPGVMALPSSGTTGEGTRIRIRGNASLSQSNEPIVYVDGVRIDNGGGFGNGFVGTGGGGRPSRLDDIDPTSIEKVEVLKGAAAATLYGTEASNGVLLITTKKGSVGAPRWQFEAEQGMKAYPQGRIENQWGIPGRQCVGSTGAPLVGTALTDCGDSVAARLSQHYGVALTRFKPFSRDFATQLFETGNLTTLGGQVSGGTPLVNYFGSVRAYREDGPFTADNFNFADLAGNRRGVFTKDINNRYSGTLSLGLTPTRTLKITSTSLYSHAHVEVPENANSIFAPYTVALFSKPENAQCNQSRTDGLNPALNGSKGNGECAGRGNPTGAGIAFGTIRELLQRSIKQDARHFNGHVRTSYIPTSALNFDATFGVDYTGTRSTAFLPFGNDVDAQTNQADNGDADVDDRTHQEITISVNGGWTRDFLSRFNSNLIFGAQGFLTRDHDESATNKEFPGPGIEVVHGGATPQVNETFSSIVNAGYFAQEQLGFGDWLFVTGGGRFDYNSAFGKASEPVFYPQASVSIIPSDRTAWNGSFISNYLSTFRLRAAIGKAGRQPGAFDKLTTYTALTAATGSGLVPQNLGNAELKPEVSTEWEVGTEMGFRDDRISFGFTRWQRKTVDALYARQFSVTGGFRRAQLDNIGEMNAWGWDARAKSFLVNRPGVSVDLYANIGFMDQIVTDLGGAPLSKVGGSYVRYRNHLKQGYYPGAFFSGKLPGACPSNAVANRLPVELAKKTNPAATVGGICLMADQMPFDVTNNTTGAAGADGIPDTRAHVLAFLNSPRAAGQLNPMQADDDMNGDRLDHYDGKPLPDFEGSFGGSATLRRNWRVSTNLEYRFGNYTISDLTGAFRRASPANGGNTEERATVEGILIDPASTPDQRLVAAQTYWNKLAGLSPFDGQNQHFDGDFIRWRELALTYTAPQKWASLAGASDLQITASARNFMLWTKYPGVDPEVNVFSRGGGTTTTDINFGESIDAFGFPLPRMFAINFRLGF